jgi:hypothetical protein
MMAELHWNFEKYDLSDAAEDIGEVKSGLATIMETKGWHGVRAAEDVHGYKPGVDLYAAVAFLYIGGRRFWEVVAMGGGTGSHEQAKQEVK